MKIKRRKLFFPILLPVSGKYMVTRVLQLRERNNSLTFMWNAESNGGRHQNLFWTFLQGLWPNLLCTSFWWAPDLGWNVIESQQMQGKLQEDQPEGLMVASCTAMWNFKLTPHSFCSANFQGTAGVLGTCSCSPGTNLGSKQSVLLRKETCPKNLGHTYSS